MGDSSKIDIKDIHSTLWRCRDFEIGHLWQRSIFLTAFLISCFTAYGVILNKIMDSLDGEAKFIIFSIIAFAISIVGSIFSILWIKMGKGSKAWYEVYESAISAMEKDTTFTEERVSTISGFRYNNLNLFDGPDQDNSVFSSKGGAYSVSRINIGIGQVFLLSMGTYWINTSHCGGNKSIFRKEFMLPMYNRNYRWCPFYVNCKFDFHSSFNVQE